MTTINYVEKLPSVDSPCSLDLIVPTQCGKGLMVPFGKAETQTKNNPKPTDQIPKQLTIKPRVFTEPSLDKNKATEPTFIEQPDNFAENTACGYLYIFVDGFCGASMQHWA